jgi:hypothetical protein
MRLVDCNSAESGRCSKHGASGVWSQRSRGSCCRGGIPASRRRQRGRRRRQRGIAHVHFVTCQNKLSEFRSNVDWKLLSMYLLSANYMQSKRELTWDTSMARPWRHPGELLFGGLRIGLMIFQSTMFVTTLKNSHTRTDRICRIKLHLPMLLSSVTRARTTCFSFTRENACCSSQFLDPSHF